MSDDGIHEISLNGKTLVFIFMATTVVLVVTFLLGVMVGRGSRELQVLNTEVLTGDVLEEDLVEEFEIAPEVVLPEDETVQTGDLSYPGRLTSPDVIQESVNPGSELIEEVLPSEAESSIAEQPPLTSLSLESVKLGFTVQVTAVRNREDAEAMLEQLRSDDYPAYLLEPNAPEELYRVRVGQNLDQKEADDMRRRLEEAQFQAWITRY
jgi:cell division septation protein DedD